MRVFIAFEIDNFAKTQIHHLKPFIEPLVKANVGHLTHQDNFHLTLRFIGEIGSKEAPYSSSHEIESSHLPDLETLKAVVSKVAAQLTAFDFDLKGFGTFEKKNRSILWLRVNDDTLTLQRASDLLESALLQSGFPPTQLPFSAHVTLGRGLRFISPNLDQTLLVLTQKALSKGLLPLQQTACRLVIMESTRIGDRLCYRPIFAAPLGKP